MNRITVFLSALAFFAMSCGSDTELKNDAAIEKIPTDVTSVSVVNVPSLLKKIDLEKVRNMKWVQEEITGKNNQLAHGLYMLLNADKVGVSDEKYVYVTQYVNPNQPQQIFNGIIINLDDADVFANYIKEIDTNIEESSGFSSIRMNNDGRLAWNDEIAVMAQSFEGSSFINERLDAIFNNTAETSIRDNKWFAEADFTEHDYSSWMTSNAIAKNPQAGFAMTMVQVSADALNDNYAHSYFDFDSGAITGEVESLLNEKLGKQLFHKFFKSETETDFSDLVPNKDLVFATTLGLDLRGIDQVLTERPQIRGYAEFFLKDMGLTLEDIITTFGGDLMIAGLSSNKMDLTDIVIAMDIKDKSRLDGFINIAVEKNILQELDKGEFKLITAAAGLPVTGSTSSLLIKDDMLIITDNQPLADLYKEGALSAADRAPSEVLEKLDDKAMGLYISGDMIEVQELKDFENFVMGFEDGEGEFSLNLKDKNKSSLMAIIEMIEGAGY